MTKKTNTAAPSIPDWREDAGVVEIEQRLQRLQTRRQTIEQDELPAARQDIDAARKRIAAHDKLCVESLAAGLGRPEPAALNPSLPELEQRLAALERERRQYQAAEAEVTALLQPARTAAFEAVRGKVTSWVPTAERRILAAAWSAREAAWEIRDFLDALHDEGTAAGAVSSNRYATASDGLRVALGDYLTARLADAAEAGELDQRDPLTSEIMASGIGQRVQKELEQRGLHRDMKELQFRANRGEGDSGRIPDEVAEEERRRNRPKNTGEVTWRQKPGDPYRLTCQTN
jgi:hypothetical protein